jgi:hypothetical protein
MFPCNNNCLNLPNITLAYLRKLTLAKLTLAKLTLAKLTLAKLTLPKIPHLTSPKGLVVILKYANCC